MIDYGTDLSCVDDFTPSMGLSTGRRLLAEACARRLITPQGSLRRHPLYGYDVRGELNSDVSRADLARINANVNHQLLRDERIVSCSCQTTLKKTGELQLDIALTDGAGPFSLTLKISDVTVQILGSQ